jgi:hypothetical protein
VLELTDASEDMVDCFLPLACDGGHGLQLIYEVLQLCSMSRQPSKRVAKRSVGDYYDLPATLSWKWR